MSAPRVKLTGERDAVHSSLGRAPEEVIISEDEVGLDRPLSIFENSEGLQKGCGEKPFYSF